MTRPKGSVNKPKPAPLAGGQGIPAEREDVPQVTMVAPSEDYEPEGDFGLHGVSEPVEAPDLSEATPLAKIPSPNPDVVWETGRAEGPVIVPARFDGDSTDDQAATLEAHDEQAANAPFAFDPNLSFEDLIASLTEAGMYDVAGRLQQQKAESDRWQAQEEEKAARDANQSRSMVFDLVEPGSEEDPFTANAPYFQPYTVADVKLMVINALTGKAEGWELEARAESLRGAGSPTTVATLKWGAEQLREVAGAILYLGDGEWITPVVEEEVVPS